MYVDIDEYRELLKYSNSTLKLDGENLKKTC